MDQSVSIACSPPVKRRKPTTGSAPSGHWSGGEASEEGGGGGGGGGGGRGRGGGVQMDGADNDPVEGGAGNEVKYEAYYSANFRAILSTVVNHSSERTLLTEEALATMERFMALPEPQQQLYVRLFLRKHQWLRVSKLSYATIAADLETVCGGLIQHNFLLDESQLADPSVVLNLLQVHELKQLSKQLNLPLSVTGSQKAQIVAALFKHDRQHRPLFGSSQFLRAVVKKAKLLLGGCVCVAEEAVGVFSRAMLLYSLVDSWLEGDDDSSSFAQIIYKMLQINTGRLVYPDYEISISQPVFSSRQDFERYYAATVDEQSLQAAIEEDDSVAFDRVLQGAKKSFQEELDQKDSAPSPAPPPFLLPFTTGWVRARLLSLSAEHLERKGRHSEANELLRLLLAQDVFCPASRGRWWDRLALNLDYHLKMKGECLEVIHCALSDGRRLRQPRRLALIQRARKICQSFRRKSSSSQKPTKQSQEELKEGGKFSLDDFPEMVLIPAPEVHITGKQYHSDKRSAFISYSNHARTDDKQPSSPHPSSSSSPHPSPSSAHPSPSSPHPSPSSLLGVEAYALQHYYSSEGWPCGLHAESGTFTAMFCLLLWDVIFAPGVPDVFRTPHQGGPLDLYTDQFYLSRKSAIDTQLTWIRTASSQELSDGVESVWQAHHGQVCIGLNWELFPSLEDAKSLAVCMGGELLSRVCEVFAKRYRQSRGGLPDLTLWDPGKRRCKFAEVKGPGDRLSLKQVVWLSRLLEWGCEAEVCKVANSKTTGTGTGT